MYQNLQSLFQYHQGKSNKAKPTNIDFFIPNFLNRLIAQTKMIGNIFEKGQFISQNNDLKGNRTELDEDLLRYLTIDEWENFVILKMEIVLLKPDQEMLSFSKKIDIIQNFLLSSINKESNGLSFHSHLDQIYVKYNLYLPSSYQLMKMKDEEQNLLLYNIEAHHRSMELQIMYYKDQLLSALALNDEEIQVHFPQQLDLYYNYIGDDCQIQIDESLKYESVIARECEIFQDQIQIDGGEQKNINIQSETDQEIANNGNNQLQILQNFNYKVIVYSVEARVGLLNQGNFRHYQEILGGELFQEFQRQSNSNQLQQQLEFEDSIHIPQADPRYKNVLQEQLPDVDISILRKILILKETLLTISENQKQLTNPKFKGRLSVLNKIKFCKVLGARPIFIMQKIKKEKKSIDFNAIRINNYQIIKNLINVLFFSGRSDDEITPIHNLCWEFLDSFCELEPQNFQDSIQEPADTHQVSGNLPDIDKYLLKLEKLILLIKSIYCVPF